MSFNFDELAAPFDAKKIHFRVGATNLDKQGNLKWGDFAQGIPLAYVDARDVMQRLDEVCGFTGWQARYPFPGCCEIGIKVGVSLPVLYPSGQQPPKLVDSATEWIWKSNGAGETDVEGQKGMYSDAFKRAAVLFGVGRYLYEMPNVWVPIDPRKKTFTKETIAELSKRYDAWVERYFQDK